MSRITAITKQLKSLWTNQQGNTAIMYALTLVPVLLGAGASIDYARLSGVQAHVQSAIDAAAIAGAAISGGSDAVRIAAAQASYDANMAAGAAQGYDDDASFVVKDGALIAYSKVDVPTSLMVLAGIETMSAEGLAEVGLVSDKKVEIALVLDYSGSMGEVSGSKVKYVAMKNAATSLITDLAASNPGKVKFGLVPFSHHVYATLPKAHVLGTSGSGDWTGCTQDRQFPFNTFTQTPTADAKSKWGQLHAPEHTSSGCSAYAPNKLVVRPLTNDFASLKSQLAAMKPYAWTHIALGVEFGYHLLSPNAPFTQGADYTDKDTQKFMIVLTDGMQTEPGFGPGTKRTVAQGETNLETLCTNAKADDITIITLAFDLDDTTTRKRLRNCSSDPATDFFVAKDDTDLMAAFQSIKLAIANDIYLRK